MKFIECKSALTRLNNKNLPYKWDLNIYRGCSHGCKYCYAIYSHKNLNGSFHSDIFVKKDLPKLLDKKLRSPYWKGEIINIGGVTDSYQKAEKKYEIMPEILRLLIKYRTPAIISTKSDLILRDLNLIAKLAKITYINIAASISTYDKKTAKIVEPGAPEPALRVEMIREISKCNASTGLHIMPILPLITTKRDLQILYKAGNEAGVDYILPGLLYLRGETKTFYGNFLKSIDLYDKFQNLYKTGRLNSKLKSKIYSEIKILENKYNLSKNYNKSIKDKLSSLESSYYLGDLI